MSLNYVGRFGVVATHSTTAVYTRTDSDRGRLPSSHLVPSPKLSISAVGVGVILCLVMSVRSQWQAALVPKLTSTVCIMYTMERGGVRELCILIRSQPRSVWGVIVVSV